MTGEEQEALLLEHRTWQLLRSMYEWVLPSHLLPVFLPRPSRTQGKDSRRSNRLQRADPEFQPLSAEKALREDAYIPPEDLAQLIVNEDEDLSLWAVGRTRLNLDLGGLRLTTGRPLSSTSNHGRCSTDHHH